MPEISILQNYVVVEFIGRGQKGKLIDIVPQSWIHVDRFAEKIKCFYPPQERLNEVQFMVKRSMEPDSSWKLFYVKCLYNTGTYCHDKNKNE